MTPSPASTSAPHPASSLPSAAEPPKALRADAQRNRAKVLAAARQAFASEGLDVQVEELARRAGVGIGTVYRHFPTKQTLLEALWADKRERVNALAREALRNPDPWGSIVEMFERGIAMMVDDLGWCEEVGARVGGLTMATAPDGLRETTEAMLERAKTAGAVRPDVDFDDVGRIFCALGSLIASQGAEAGRGLLRVILDGLRPPR